MATAAMPGPPASRTQGSADAASDLNEVPVPWPALDDYWRLPLASREGLTASAAIARTRRAASRSRVKQVQRLHQRTEKSQSQLWKRQVREWLDQHQQSTDWGPPVKDEVMLVGWFRSIDAKKTGTVSAAEVASFLRGSGVDIGRADVESQLVHLGRDPAARFDTHVFVHVMSRASRDTDTGTGRELDKATADLHIMATRRQRMLTDIQQPGTRRPFETYDGFCKEYGVGLRAPKQHGREYHAGLKLAAGGRPVVPRPTMMEILHPTEEGNAWDKAARDWEKEAREGARIRAKLGLSPESRRTVGLAENSRASTPAAHEGRSEYWSLVAGKRREIGQMREETRQRKEGVEAAGGGASGLGMRWTRPASMVPLHRAPSDAVVDSGARSPGMAVTPMGKRSGLKSAEDRLAAQLSGSRRMDGVVSAIDSGAHARAHPASPQPRGLTGSASIAHLPPKSSPSAALGHSVSMAMLPNRAPPPAAQPSSNGLSTPSAARRFRPSQSIPALAGLPLPTGTADDTDGGSTTDRNMKLSVSLPALR